MRILYVENHAIFARTVIDQFLSSHSVKVVPTVAAALDALANDAFELLLVDYDLDDAKGDELVRVCAKTHPTLKIIATSAHERGNAALVEAGAVAVCRKMQFDRMPALIEKITQPQTSASSETPSPKTPKEIVKAWVEAFNRADPYALAAFYSADATNHQVAESPVTGRNNIRAMFAEGFAKAEMTCIIENLFEDGEWAILEWRDPSGLRGCGFFHIQNSKIIFQRGYWDKLTFLKLHGLQS